MSVPDTLRMDLADPRIYDEITLDRRQALALVNEVDSLREQTKTNQAEVDRLKVIIHDVESLASEMSQDLLDACEQRDQLLAQLEKLWNAVKSYGQIGYEGSELLEVMSDAREMITKMKESSHV